MPPASQNQDHSDRVGTAPTLVPSTLCPLSKWWWESDGLPTPQFFEEYLNYRIKHDRQQLTWPRSTMKGSDALSAFTDPEAGPEKTVVSARSKLRSLRSTLPSAHPLSHRDACGQIICDLYRCFRCSLPPLGLLRWLLTGSPLVRSNSQADCPFPEDRWKQEAGGEEA